METETRQLRTRSKRDAESLVRLLNSTAAAQPLDFGACKAEVARVYVAGHWTVRHDFPRMVVSVAIHNAYRRGAMVQVAYLEDHLRNSCLEE